MRKLSQINERLFNNWVKRAVNGSPRLGDEFATNIMEIKTVDFGHPTLLFADRLLVIDDGLTDEIQYNNEWMKIRDEVEGRGWRLPTKDEAKRIMEIFDFSRTRKDTVTFTSEVNGKSVNYRQITHLMIGWFMLEKTDACKKDGTVPVIAVRTDKFSSEKVRIKHASDFLGLNVVLVKEKKVNERLFGSGVKRAVTGSERLETPLANSNIKEIQPVDLGDDFVFLWADRDLEIEGRSWFTLDEVESLTGFEQYGWKLPTKLDCVRIPIRTKVDAEKFNTGEHLKIPYGERLTDTYIRAHNDKLGTEVIFPNWNSTTSFAMDPSSWDSRYAHIIGASMLDNKLRIIQNHKRRDNERDIWVRIRLTRDRT